MNDDDNNDNDDNGNANDNDNNNDDNDNNIILLKCATCPPNSVLGALLWDVTCTDLLAVFLATGFSFGTIKW